MRLPTLSCVTCENFRAPAVLRLTLTEGWPFWSKPVEALVISSPVSSICLLTITGWPSRLVLKNSSPGGTMPLSASALLLASE